MPFDTLPGESHEGRHKREQKEYVAARTFEKQKEKMELDTLRKRLGKSDSRRGLSNAVKEDLRDGKARGNPKFAAETEDALEAYEKGKHLEEQLSGRRAIANRAARNSMNRGTVGAKKMREFVESRNPPFDRYHAVGQAENQGILRNFLNKINGTAIPKNKYPDVESTTVSGEPEKSKKGRRKWFWEA